MFMSQKGYYSVRLKVKGRKGGEKRHLIGKMRMNV